MSGNNLANRIGISRYHASWLDVVVLVPCCSKEHAIAKVVSDFRAADGAAAAARLLAFLSFACGLILDTVTRGRRQAKLMAYLASRARRGTAAELNCA